MVRHKNRYFVVQVNDENTGPHDKLALSQVALYKGIIQRVQQLHGDFGVAAIRAGFTAKYCNPHTKIAVIRSRHGPHSLVASALPLINKLDTKRVSLNTLYTGATIRQCFKFIKRYQQQIFDEFCVQLKTEEEKKAMKRLLLNSDEVMEIS